ncbi:MAG TPA: zinc-ribbon domain-containing transport protein, partial [Clostridia bacterium]|nr:zinc-ribbon domain-containing transport protein [Clostridia bacterium]
GSDWGGGSSDWSSGSTDWGSGGYTDSDGFSLGGGGGIFFAILVIVVLVILFSKKNKGGSQPVAPGAARTVLPMTIAQLKQMDPQFSEEALKEKIANLYIKMQAAWQEKKWEPMRASLSDALFNQMKSGVDAKIRNRQTNYVERIAILGVDLTGFGQDDKHDIVTAVLQTRIVDYTLDDTTGNLMSGSRTAEKFMTYEWTLIRTKGAKTFVSNEDETKHCPNCGAPLDLNHSTKCAYCGAIISSAEYDWVLNNIKGLSQRTVGK